MMTALYENRLLIFLEIEPQSNKYNQILLNKDSFKQLSDKMAEIFKAVPDPEREGKEIMQLTVSEEVYSLPDIQSIDHGI